MPPVPGGDRVGPDGWLPPPVVDEPVSGVDIREYPQVRARAVSRVVAMSFRHGNFAWEVRRSQPVGPHGLAFLFHTPEVEVEGRHSVGGWEVAAATRLVDDGPEVRDLPRLLFRFAELVRDRYAANQAGWDVRELCNRADPMVPRAVYLGLAVSTLDDAWMPWGSGESQVRNAGDVSGRCLLLLRDDTRAIVERGGRETYRQIRVWTTTRIAVAPQNADGWRLAADTELFGMTGVEVWRQMAELDALVPAYLGGAR